VWDNAEISFSDEVEARSKRYPTTPTTWLLLRDFEAQVSEDDDVDWVLHVASVVSRLIKPFFASTVFSAALYARERADLLALVKYGVVVTSDEGARVHGRNRARHSHSPKRPAQRVWRAGSVRVLLYIPFGECESARLAYAATE
jgi:hypothetical protein